MSDWLDTMAGVNVVDVSVDVLLLSWPVEIRLTTSRVLAHPGCPVACMSWWSLNMRSRRVSLSGIHMRPLYISNPLFSSHSPSVIFPLWDDPFTFFLWISWIALSAVLSVWISLRSSLSISRLMVSIVLVWSTLAWLSIRSASKASSGNRIQL